MTMKRILSILAISAIIGLLARQPSEAITITPGVTFYSNQQVNAEMLNTLVSGAQISGIAGSDIADGSIAAVDLGASSVITSKIQDGAVTASKLGALAVGMNNIATNAVGTVQLSTNVDLSGKVITFGTNQIPGVSLVGTNAGPGTAGQVIKLGAAGIIDSTLLPSSFVISTNLITATGGADTYVWATIATLTTTATNGSVVVEGRATPVAAMPSIVFLRIRDATTNFARSVTTFNPSGFNSTWMLCVGGVDTLGGTAKTYTLEAACSSGNIVFTNATSNSGLQAPPVADGLGLRIIQIQ